MQTIVLDGKEYVLVPAEQLQEVPPKPQESALIDFLQDNVPLIDDGLATEKEKQTSIRVLEGNNLQEIVTNSITAPKAHPKPYLYRERYLRKELLPSDIMTFSRMNQSFLDSNPEDPMIKADAKKPRSRQVFYGPSTEQE